MPPAAAALPMAAKTFTTGLAPAGNAPLLSPAATSSPEGEILAALYFELLMRVKVERRVNFPLRGKSRTAGIGVHFHAPQARLFGFAAERHMKTSLPPRQRQFITLTLQARQT